MNSKTILKGIMLFNENINEELHRIAKLGLQKNYNSELHEKITRYLKDGVVLVYSPGLLFEDNHESKPIGTNSILTDGVWAWSDILSYYFENYNLKLSEEFINHIIQNDFIVPKLSNNELRNLSLL